MTLSLSLAIRNYTTSYAGLPRTCWQGIFINFIESIFYSAYSFIPIYFVSVLHFDITVAGMIMSCYGLGTILGGFLGGKLSDRLSPKTVLISSLLFQILTTLALIKLKFISLLMINLFMMGMAFYGFLTANHLWVLEQCHHEEIKLKALNLLGVVSNLGLGISSFIMSSLLSHGFQYVFSVTAVILFLLMIYSSLIKKNALGSSFEKENQINLSDSDNVQANKKIFWMVLGCVFLVGLMIFQMSTTYSFYIQNMFPEWGIKGVSILFALNAFLIVLFQVPIGSYFSKYNKLLLVGSGALLLGLGFSLLSFPFTFAIAVLSCMVYTIGEILFFSAAQLMCYQYGPKKGHSVGFYRMIYACSRVVAPTGGTWAYKVWGGQMIWYLCGVIGMTCLMGCRYVGKTVKSY